MCGRYTLASIDPWDLRARFPAGSDLEIRPRFNVAPSDEVLAVTTDTAGSQRLELLRWGLVPFWADGPDTKAKMINARSETVAERPAYRRAFESFRCLILADGFYEWRPGPDGRKEAFHITRGDGSLFSFAGLWSIWRPRTEESAAADKAYELRSCTILTTAANEVVAPLHDRMPVILPRTAEEVWLDSSTPAPVLHSLLRPLDADETVIRAVGPAVNDVRYDGPDCLEPPTPRQAALF